MKFDDEIDRLSPCSPSWPWASLLVHINEHLGQLIAYGRVTPLRRRTSFALIVTGADSTPRPAGG